MCVTARRRPSQQCGLNPLALERLDWLEAELATRTGEPVVIAMHHPPFTTLVGHMGKVGLMRGIEQFGRTAATGVVSHLAAAGRFEGPYPFHEADGALID